MLIVANADNTSICGCVCLYVCVHLYCMYVRGVCRLPLYRCSQQRPSHRLDTCHHRRRQLCNDPRRCVLSVCPSSGSLGKAAAALLSSPARANQPGAIEMTTAATGTDAGGVFTYNPVPVLFGVEPAAARLAGGVCVTLSGASLGSNDTTIIWKSDCRR